MEKRLQVFISSTSDLQEERSAVAAALPAPFVAYLYEKDRARDQAPRDRIGDVLDRSDAFVGILGGSYGSVYPDAQGDTSIVEWEFDEASRRQIEFFPYRKDVPPERIEKKQVRFLERVGRDFIGGNWSPSFQKVGELTTKVITDLASWGGEILVQTMERDLEKDENSEPVPDTFRRSLRWTAVGALVLLLTVGVVQLIKPGFSTLALLIFAGIVMLVILGCATLSRF